ETDRPEEGPGRAVDRERERIDQHPRAPLAAAGPRAVAIARDEEQQADVAECDGDNEPALQHGRSDRRRPGLSAPGRGCRAFSQTSFAVAPRKLRPYEEPGHTGEKRARAGTPAPERPRQRRSR